MIETVTALMGLVSAGIFLAHAHQYEPNRAIIKSGHCDFQTKLRKRTKARQRELAVLGVMPKTSALLL